MFRFRLSLPLLATALIAACATGPDGTALTAPRIYEACTAVELPKAQEMYREEGKPVEDAKLFTHYICKVISGTCAQDPTKGSCPRHLREYGLTK